MKVSLDSLIEAREELIKHALNDSEELINRAERAEEELSQLRGKNAYLPEMANAIANTRWQNGNNPGSFLTRPSEEILVAVHKNGLHAGGGRHGRKSGKANLATPGMDNPYFSWPSSFCFPAAFYSAREFNGRRDWHLKLVMNLGKFLPSSRFDPDRDPLTIELMQYAGEENREAVKTAMLFSLAGELYQNSIGLSAPQELRAHIIGVKKVRDYLADNGVEGLEKRKLSEYIRDVASEFQNIEKIVEEHGIKEQIEHFERESRTRIGKIVLDIMKAYFRAVENNPRLRKNRIAGYLYRNMRPSVICYESIPFGVFPARINASEMRRETLPDKKPAAMRGHLQSSSAELTY